MPDRRPNLLIFLTDDHGAWALNCYGGEGVHSPTMDWIARTGARLDAAYTPSPVCSPARATFFTGRIPSCHGIHDYLQETAEAYQGHPGLTGQTNLGMLLHEAGYQTALIGKWHCGDSWAPAPGWDRWYSYGQFQFPHKGPIQMSDHGKKRDVDGYQTTHFTDQALDFLRHRDRQRPFALVFGLVDTHSPHMLHPERLVQSIDPDAVDAILDEPFSEAHGVKRFSMPDDPAERKKWRRQYLAAVAMIDEQIGRLVDEVDGQGELDQTLTLYTSDHGYMLGHHGLPEKGNASVPQNFLEEAVRVPCVLRWPGVIEAGQSLDATVSHCDTWATLLDAAGIDLSEEQRLELRSPGRSYLPMLRGEALPDDWEQAFFGDYGNARCIRLGPHKLIRRGAGPNGHFPDEFYDLGEDPRETENRIDEPRYAEIIKQLDARLRAYFERWSDPEKDGWEIADQPLTGGHEPWRGEPGPVR